MPSAQRIGSLTVWDWPGRPPDTLLLHGIGNYGRYWDFFADTIAGRLRLIAPDARGHGDSDKPATGYAPADFVGDATSVIDERTSDRPLVLHLHGYDIERRVAASAVTEFAFTAAATGRFPIEIHDDAHHEPPLAIIEVYPR